jgi:hypothetical protein
MAGSELLSGSTSERQLRKQSWRRWAVLACLITLMIVCVFLVRRRYFSDDPSAVRLPQVNIGHAAEILTTGNKDEVADEGTAQKKTAQHPLVPVLKIARDGLAGIKANLVDYEATLVKRERVGENLVGPEKLLLKFRRRKKENEEIIVPLSVYLKFEEPQSRSGREVIWVEGKNDDKLIVNEPGISRFLGRLNLPPEGLIAMQGNRYPIWCIGFEFLIEELIRFGEADLRYGECEVQISKEVEVEGRLCTLVKVCHPKKREHFEFHVAEIFIDNERNLPIRFACYDWPAEESNEPVMLEEYTYLNIKLNVGLTDGDFDPDNPAYGYP